MALVYVFKDGKRLTIADLALVGLAVGLGFEFVESNLRALARGSIEHDLADVTPFVAGWRGLGNGAAYALGHGVWTALVGSARAWVCGLWPRRALAWAPCVVALLYVTLEHAAFNADVHRLSDADVRTALVARPVLHIHLRRPAGSPTAHRRTTGRQRHRGAAVLERDPTANRSSCSRASRNDRW